MLTYLLRSAAPWIASDAVVTSICFGLLTWTVWSGVKLFSAGRKLKGCLSDAWKLVAASSTSDTPDPVAFAASYEDISNQLATNSLLGQPWRGFQQCLIVPSVPGRTVTATAAPRDWFDLASLFRNAGADLRYHAALPGLLVGAGLLFTFLGLAAALSSAGEIVAEGVDQARRNAELRNLLGAASVKFITSLAGLSLSICYALFRKRQLKQAEKSLSEFLGILQDQLPFRSAAALQAEGNIVMEKQYADVQRIGSDFFVNLGSTLEREFGEGLQQHIGPLAAALEKLSDGLARQNEGAMEAMLRTFLERLEGAVGESMRGTTATLDALGERLTGLQAGLDAAAGRMGRAAEEMAAGMGRGAEAALGGITEQVSALVAVLRGAAEEAARSNRVAGDDMARRMADTAVALTDAIASFQRKMEEGAAQGVDRLAAPIEALLGGLRSLSDAQRQAGEHSLSALAAGIARAADALEATATRAGDALDAGALDAGNRLVAATEAMRADLRDVLDRFGAALDQSGATLARGVEASGDALRAASAGLGQDVSVAAQQLRDAGTAAGGALRDGGNEAKAGLMDGARMVEQGGTAAANRLASLGATGDGLAQQVAALSHAADAAAQPLARTAADLRAAGEAVRGAAGPLGEVAANMRAALDGLAGAAASFKAAQAASDGLAGRFGAASDRFGGLDASLAATFDRLREGLQGQQDHLTKFVLGMDAGLNKSMGQLNALVKELLDAVQDFEDVARKAPKAPVRVD